MKSVSEIEIAAPLARVVRFVGPAHFPRWMQGPPRYEQLSGQANQPGSTFRLTGSQPFDGKILAWDLPHAIVFELTSPGVRVHTTARFDGTADDHTHYTLEQEFAFADNPDDVSANAAEAIKKQQREDVQRFKQFVEAQ